MGHSLIDHKGWSSYWHVQQGLGEKGGGRGKVLSKDCNWRKCAVFNTGLVHTPRCV